MNKKGQGLSITTVIVAVIAIVVLVVLIAVFTGRIAIFQTGLGGVGTCIGQPTLCSSYGSEAKCGLVAGCTWAIKIKQVENGQDITSASCTGSPTPCGGTITEDACGKRSGCSWQASE